MQDTAKNPNVLEACSVDGRLDTLRMLSEQLETCQKSLSEYLDTKRCAFPRFAFNSCIIAVVSKRHQHRSQHRANLHYACQQQPIHCKQCLIMSRETMLQAAGLSA